MFDIGWQELLVIAVVLIVVVGPKDLPRMLRAFGKATSRMRSMAGEFRSQFDEALREADLDDVRKTISDAQSLNPAKSLRDAMNPLRQVGDEIRAGLNEVVQPSSLSVPAADDADALASVRESAAGGEASSASADAAKAPARRKAASRKGAAKSGVAKKPATGGRTKAASSSSAPPDAKRKAAAPRASTRSAGEPAAEKPKGRTGGKTKANGTAKANGKSGQAASGTGAGARRNGAASGKAARKPADKTDNT